MATIQISVDDSFKAEIDNLFLSLGLDTSTAVKMFLSNAYFRNEAGKPRNSAKIIGKFDPI